MRCAVAIFRCEDYFGRIMEVVTFLGGEARHVG